MNSACHGLKMSFSEERCRNCKKIPSLSFNLVPQTISNTVICTMQIVLASVFTKYFSRISAEPRLESGLSGRHAGVSWRPGDPMASHGSFLQESRFPFTELPFDGIFGLGLGGLSAGFSATFGRLLEHLWAFVIVISCHFHFFQVESCWNLFETYLMYRKVFSGVPHIFSCKALGLKTRIDVIFLKGRTFFQLCQPFGRLVPNYDELLWWC